MLRIFFIVSFCLSALWGNAQAKEVDSIHTITKALEAFRYSMYADLSKKDADANLLFATAQDTTSAFFQKCRQFYDRHINELMAYQHYQLAKHINTLIDTTAYSSDHSFDSAKADALSIKEAFTNTYLYRILTADPISNASAVIQMAFVQVKDVSEMSTRTFLQQIAQPRIRTEKINEDNWNIYWDEYNHIYLLSYQVSQQEMRLKNVYKRK